MTQKDWKQRAGEEADRLRDEMVALSRTIFADPELSGEEHRSAARLCAALEKHGFTIEVGLAGLPTAFRATRPDAGPGPKIAFLAEYDALPVVGHGCGHNLLGTGCLAPAVALRHWLEDQGLPGIVRYYGCSAEEQISGKTFMARDGVFDDLDAAFNYHPGKTNGAGKGSAVGVNELRFRFHGKTAHAGGLRSEKLADAESIKVLEATEGLGRVLGTPVAMSEAEVRAAVLAFDRPTGATHVDNFFNRLRNLFRYGTTGRRVSDLERAARGEEIDTLKKWRRPDGSLKWKTMVRDGALGDDGVDR